MAMTMVVAYDISSDAARARCAALLQTFGNRVQRSVYVCVVDDDQFGELRSRVEGLIDLESDIVTFYRLCKDCWGGIMSIGAYAPVESEPYWAVF